jgi:hypothetical protein
MIRNLLHTTDPYAGFDHTQFPGEPLGWNDHSEEFAKLLGPDSRLIIEIGSWLGNSALHIASLAPSAEVVCIDTWLGAREMWENHGDASRYGTLKLINGYPSLYYYFLANVVRAGKQSQITPFPVSSGVGFEWLRRNAPPPDLVYVDGSHNFNDVCSDIRDAMALNPKVICGDDFGDWQDVRDAVLAMIPDVEVKQKGLWVKRFK